jgi:RHS repeat-associated protein
VVIRTYGYANTWKDDWQFDSYGAVQAQSNTKSTNSNHALDVIGFAGQQGGYYDTFEYSNLMTHRFYDPGTGRFVNRDPLGYGGGLNE